MNSVPRDLDAERWTLGAMLLDNAVIDDVTMEVTPEDFHLDDHATICRAIFELRDQGKPATAITLGDLLSSMSRDKHRLQMTEELLGSVPHALDAVPHARIVRDKAIKRELMTRASEIIAECSRDQEAASVLVERAESSIYSVAEREASGETVEAVVAVDRAIARAELREQGNFSGVTTGLVDLDETLDGFRPGQLIILAARPGIGKTALALNVALHVSVDCNQDIFFVSLEMGDVELADRIIASRGRIDGQRIRSGMARSPSEKEAKRRVRAEMASIGFGIDYTSVRTMGQIAANARRRQRRRGLDLLIVDYIQLVDTGNARNESRQEQVAKMSRRLKTLAKELGVPILALSQLNRQSESREDRRPRLSDLRESGSLEQDADVVLLLHRPDMYEPNERPREVDLIIAKNRAGPTGTVTMTYLKEFTRFENHARGGEF